MSPHNPASSRRRFLRQSLAALAGGAGFFAAPQSLSLLNAAWAQQPSCSGDYKALVCVFLLGGNDGHNLVVPRGSVEYAHYATRRRGLAIAQNQLLPITPQAGAAFPLGLHPAVPELAQLFETGKLAIVGNVGALLQPVTRQQYDDRSARLPPQLFSHNDQQAFWQSLQARSATDTTPASGWAGRLADLAQPRYNACASLAMNLSLAGANPFQVGRGSEALSVDSGQISAIETDRDPTAAAVLEAVYGDVQSNLLAEEYRRATRRAIDDYAVLRSALAAAAPLATPFPPPPGEGDPASARFAFTLGNQLRRAAELISVRQALGHRRQIFFCSLGGFDTHDAQSADQPQLLAGLSQALAAFHRATQELAVESQVTTFAASEFGRSMTSNGDGSDHGWGNHLFVLGGAVAGRRVYGAIPDLAASSEDFAADGNLIPKIGVDQYGATLARWFGIEDAALLDDCFPNLRNFAQRDLGFMSGP
ncbi:uncharacterized protein (DUF1501 family) [Tahibacter aquaticus]|uniref:Uncharacterized protein (DUF1501 family) n=1 Tax=Tahibacter aquaticus TaxID=520092 RepID=A0A4R6Z7I9_9GAMM|nr:DUF1501 domain-containing protein [Tahibacter aquaticus]TDR47694.1 uncharacterized protein (DUF1501 family) [Tahibacter aquaticus]